MFVKNNTTGKFYIDSMEVTKSEYETRLADFWANCEPPEPDPDPELSAEQALDVIVGGAANA